MYVCMCNPFTDKDVKTALQDSGVKKSVADVYKACSGGQTPCCGSCVCMVKDMVASHEQAELIAAE